ELAQSWRRASSTKLRLEEELQESGSAHCAATVMRPSRVTELTSVASKLRAVPNLDAPRIVASMPDVEHAARWFPYAAKWEGHAQAAQEQDAEVTGLREQRSGRRGQVSKEIGGLVMSGVQARQIAEGLMPKSAERQQPTAASAGGKEAVMFVAFECQAVLDVGVAADRRAEDSEPLLGWRERPIPDPHGGASLALQCGNAMAGRVQSICGAMAKQVKAVTAAVAIAALAARPQDGEQCGLVFQDWIVHETVTLRVRDGCTEISESQALELISRIEDKKLEDLKAATAVTKGKIREAAISFNNLNKTWFDHLISYCVSGIAAEAHVDIRHAPFFEDVPKESLSMVLAKRTLLPMDGKL
ncbi:unnamed protein product, partial [Symbiodinium sp. KB8]